METCLNPRQRDALLQRVRAKRPVGHCTSDAEGARWRHERGERIVHIDLRSPGEATGCTCGEHPIAGMQAHIGLRQRLLNATMLLGHLYSRTVRLGSPVAHLPPSVTVSLHDFDGNRAKCLKVHQRDFNGVTIDHKLKRAPPTLSAHAFDDEHSLAAPSFTWDVLGWDYQPVPQRVSLPDWSHRKPKLVWRGGVGMTHGNAGRVNLIRAATARPDLIDAFATDGAPPSDIQKHFCRDRDHRLLVPGDGKPSQATASIAAAPWMSMEDQAHYMYAAATQGFMATPSWRLRALFELEFAVFMEALGTNEVRFSCHRVSARAGSEWALPSTPCCIITNSSPGGDLICPCRWPIHGIRTTSHLVCTMYLSSLTSKMS